MPKVSKVKAPRASPVAVTPVVAKAPKPVKTTKPSSSSTTPKARKPFVPSTNFNLPVVATSADDLAQLQSLKNRATNSEEVSFNALFTRQDKFGRMEFQLTDETHEQLMAIITDGLEYDLESGGSICVDKDDYTGHFRIKGKLSKSYLSAHSDPASVPVPAPGSLVAVGGVIETGKMKGKDMCYCQINSLATLSSEVAPEYSAESDSE